MGRPRKTNSQIETGSRPEVPAPVKLEAEPARATAASKPVAGTITIRLDESGKPLPIQDETRERLRKAIREGGLLEEPLEELAPSGIIDEEFAGHVLDAVNEAQAFLVSRTAPLSIEEARKVVKYDPDQKEEMSPRLARILNKHLGWWLARHPDEYALLLALSVVSAEQWARARELAKKSEAKSETHN
jgi:hypothetical protein